MKGTLCNVLVALATFLIGTASHSVFYTQEEPPLHFHEDWVPTAAPRVDSGPPPLPLPAVPEVVFDFDPTEFNPGGHYQILGRKPKGFREFDSFGLPIDERGKVIGEVWLQYFVAEAYAANYAVSGSVTKERIYLVSQPLFEGDVEYRFEGEFLRQGELWRAGRSRAVLKGRLSKIKDGVKIAEAVVRFRVEYSGC